MYDWKRNQFRVMLYFLQPWTDKWHLPLPEDRRTLYLILTDLGLSLGLLGRLGDHQGVAGSSLHLSPRAGLLLAGTCCSPPCWRSHWEPQAAGAGLVHVGGEGDYSWCPNPRCDILSRASLTTAGGLASGPLMVVRHRMEGERYFTSLSFNVS